MSTKDNMAEVDKKHLSTLSTEKELYVSGTDVSSDDNDSDADTLVSPSVNNINHRFGFVPNPERALLVNSRGIKWWRLPVPTSQLEIQIVRDTDQSLAYTSIRPQRNSDDASLLSAEGKELVKNVYSPLPGKAPRVYVVGQMLNAVTNETEAAEPTEYLKIESKWTTRAVTLTDQRDGKLFTWRYLKTPGNGADGKADKNLVLTVRGGNAGLGEKIIAQLLRNDTHRTPGTSKRNAGVGGRLDLDDNADAYMPEPLIVATCLMMLYKELERRRTAQFLMLAGATSGGGS